MFKRLTAIAALLWITTATLEAAQEQVLVQPADLERIIRLQDGRQIRLPAGTELIRSPDGRLMVRRPMAAPPAAPQQTPAPKTAKSPRLQPAEAPRVSQSSANAGRSSSSSWGWFAGLEAAQRSISRNWSITTEAIEDAQAILPDGTRVDLDGSTHSVNLSEGSTSFALSAGLKDFGGENSYSATYQMDSELSELMVSAQFGFPSVSVVADMVPYARLMAAVGFSEGITSFEANAFAYGFGVGATYPYSDSIETYFGVDLITRQWGDVIARDATIGTYGVEKVEDSETRLYLGARYYFK